MPQPATIADDTPSSPAPATVRHRWRGLALLTGTMIVDSDEGKLITTLFPMLRSALALPTAAFAVMLSIVQAIAWAIYALGAGFLADAIGMKATFFWLLVVVMIANGLFCSLIYRPYVRDCAALDAELAARNA
jgi:hypothetical protein